jgi:GH24 family phage-related lysozyme (muramidase)
VVDLERFVKRLKVEEGFSPKPYWDNDHWTWGYGTPAPDERGEISEEAAEVALRSEAAKAIGYARALVPRFDTFSDARQESLADMAFNLGLSAMAHFQRMIAAINHDDWLLAALAVEDSLYFREVGKRAQRVRDELATGEFVVPDTAVV